jgi:hypothetical protein
MRRGETGYALAAHSRTVIRSAVAGLSEDGPAFDTAERQERCDCSADFDRPLRREAPHEASQARMDAFGERQSAATPSSADSFTAAPPTGLRLLGPDAVVPQVGAGEVDEALERLGPPAASMSLSCRNTDRRNRSGRTSKVAQIIRLFIRRGQCGNSRRARTTCWTCCAAQAEAAATLEAVEEAFRTPGSQPAGWNGAASYVFSHLRKQPPEARAAILDAVREALKGKSTS